MSKRSPPANLYRPSRPTRFVALKNPSYSDKTYYSDNDDKPAAATTTSNTSKPKRLALADWSNSMTLSSHVILRNNCSETTKNNFFLKLEIISDYKTMSGQKITEKWHLTEGKPYSRELKDAPSFIRFQGAIVPPFLSIISLAKCFWR